MTTTTSDATVTVTPRELEAGDVIAGMKVIADEPDHDYVRNEVTVTVTYPASDGAAEYAPLTLPMFATLTVTRPRA